MLKSLFIPAGESGVVTSVTGTVNQINVANGTTTPVLSISSTFIAPGTLAATSGAFGGATIGTDALGVAGTSTFSGAILANGGVNFNNNGIIGLRAITTILSSPAAAYLQLGAADAASPVAQTLGVQNVVAGTSNIAGANTLFNLSVGTGSGVGGNLTFNGAPHGAAATVQNTLVPLLTLNGDTLAATFGGAISSVGGHTFTTATSGIVLKRGANGLCGTVVANGTSAVAVSNTNVAITDSIILSLNTVGGTVGVIGPTVVSITATSGFSIKAQALDTSTYNWAIIKNAA